MSVTITNNSKPSDITITNKTKPTDIVITNKDKTPTYLLIESGFFLLTEDSQKIISKEQTFVSITNLAKP